MIIVLLQVAGEVGRGQVGVVAADGVEDVHAVALQLPGGDGQRILAIVPRVNADQLPLTVVAHWPPGIAK